MGEVIVIAQRHSNLPVACRLGKTLCEPVPAMARFVFRGDPAAQTAAGQALGVPFAAPLRASEGHAISIQWQGPDEFLIIAETDRKDRISEAIETACAETPHSLVDVSHRNIALKLHGPDVTTLLATSVQLDLSVEAFPIGMTTRTLFAKADITLWRQSEDCFHVEIWRSFLPYVFGILGEGARGL